MRKLLALFAATVLTATGVQRAEAAVSVDFFYTSLQDQGSWLETDDYGYVFQPSEVAEDWRPYSVGNWAYTDAGWTWVSEEPHGWATHHYGRWVDVESTGWVWVPDTEWAPAWVSWRRSETHVGWAPLPPEARFERTVGIQTWSDSYYDIGPTNYSFVTVKNMGAPRLATVILPPRENVTIINNTTNITNIVVRNDIIINEGPQYDVVVRESAQPIRRLRLERQTDFAAGVQVRGDSLRTTVQGDVLRIAAPDVQVNVNVDARPAKVARRLETVSVNRGWKGLEQDAKVKEYRAKVAKDAPKPPAALPPKPRFERMAERAKRNEGRNQADAAAVAPGTERPAGQQPTVGTDPEMRRPGRAGQPPATTEAAPADGTKPAPAAGTAGENARPGRDRANRRDRDMKEPAATAPDATAPATAVPGAESPAPADATKPAPAPATAGETTRPGKDRDMKAPGAAKPDGAAPTTAVPDAETPAPDAAAGAPANRRERRQMREDAAKRGKEGAAAETAVPDATKDRSKAQQNAAERAKTEAAPDAEKAPAPASVNADEQKSEAKMRREAAQEGRKQDAQSAAKKRDDAPASSPAAATQAPASSDEKRPPGAAARDRSPAGGRPEAAERKEDRPEKAERPERPQAGAAGGQPNRPAGGAGAGRADRPSGAPDAGKSAGPGAGEGAAARPAGARGARERAEGAGKKADEAVPADQ